MEFAIVVPVLFLLVIGMLEFAFVMRDYLAVSSSTRVGARIAATGANAGQGTCPGLPIICVPGNVPALAQDAADAIQQAGTAMPQDTIDYILVYKSNDKGYPGSAGNTTMPTMTACTTSVADCVAFRWAKTIDRFVYVGGAWNSTLIYACAPTAGNTNGPDSVGVFMQATHPYLSKFFGQTITLSNRSVMQFEPLAINQCASGQHQ